MKRSTYFALVLGVAIASLLKLFGIEINTILWWIIDFPVTLIFCLIYFKLKD